jgi:cell division protein ZapA
VSDNRKNITVSVLSRGFSFACEPDEESRVKEAAAYLDSQMRDIQQAGKILGNDRIAIMAAMNICFELFALRENAESSTTITNRIKSLSDMIENALPND